MSTFPCLVRFESGLARCVTAWVTGWWAGIWSSWQAGANRTRCGRCARGAGAARPSGQGLAVLADRFCERDEVFEHGGYLPSARGPVADEVIDPEAGQPADQVVLARACWFSAVDALVGGGEFMAVRSLMCSSSAERSSSWRASPGSRWCN
jgi:hypothetical protein